MREEYLQERLLLVDIFLISYLYKFNLYVIIKLTKGERKNNNGKKSKLCKNT